jgi:hypothetical protein
MSNRLHNLKKTNITSNYACDVGNGRDKSVINICNVSLDSPDTRLVGVSHNITEMRADIDPIDFAYEIKRHLEPYESQNISVLIDGYGVGFSTVKIALELSLNVQKIRWGNLFLIMKRKSRFINQ